LALTLVALALVAMAVVPVVLGRRVSEAQARISTVLEPAARAASRLALLQARQMTRFQSFLLTGDRSYRSPYIAALKEERELYEELGRLARGLDFDVRERLAGLSAESTRWHFDNQQAFDSGSGPDTDGSARAANRRAYDEIEKRMRELERAIQSEVAAGRREIDRLHAWQTWVTLALAIVALGAVFVVARVGRRLRGFMAEAELRRAEAVRARREMDAILEATGDGVLGIDLEGKCTSLNRVGVDLLGYSEREIMGRDVHETLCHSDPSGVPSSAGECRILGALREGRRAESADGDVLWRRDGRAFPVRWTLLPLIDGIERRGAVLTFTDMTEIEEKEAALRRAVEQREEVVSIVSHDLRNPLGVVSAAADLLIDLPLDDEERRQQAEIIKRSAERMERLIGDLLDVARIEAGAFLVRPADEPVRPLLEEAREAFSHQAECAGVSILIDAPEALRVHGDRDRILQALGNLLDNALRFTPADGSVEVGAALDEGGIVALFVADTGRGMPPEAIEHLFDRFWQAEAGERGGAGLGLAIVKGIAEAHGGEVVVESEEGAGTHFEIRLPAAAPRR
jgi:PAS domain S-box-containing protein